VRRTDLTLVSARYDGAKQARRAEQIVRRRAKAEGKPGGAAGGCCGCGSRPPREVHTQGELSEGLVAEADALVATLEAPEVGAAAAAGGRSQPLGTLHCSHWEPAPHCRPGGAESKCHGPPRATPRRGG
jgi:hypothetical protein